MIRKERNIAARIEWENRKIAALAKRINRSLTDVLRIIEATVPTNGGQPNG